MTEANSLSGLLTEKQFELIDKEFREKYKIGLETIDNNGVEINQLCSKDNIPRYCQIIRRNKEGMERCRQQRLSGIKIAADKGKPYITICHAGIVLVFVSIIYKKKVHGTILFGKSLWEPVTKIVAGDIEKRQSENDIEFEELKKALKELPVTDTKQIKEATDLLYELLYENGKIDQNEIKRWRNKYKQQSKIGENIKKKKNQGDKWQNAINREREILRKIRAGDKDGAKEIINSILGEILHKDIGDLGIVKARQLELVSMLSRAAVEGGVDVNLMLQKNLAYVNKVMQIDNKKDLCVWLRTTVDEFIEQAYSSRDSRKIGQLRPAIVFIEENFSRAITLAEVARACHLSISRLGHLFKEQMGITVIDYLTSVRIEHAKRLLVSTDKSCTDICFTVGYKNQSYFSRTFKLIVRMTPRQFRVRNRHKTVQ